MAALQHPTVVPTKPCFTVELDWLAATDRARVFGAFPRLPIQAQTVLQLIYVEELEPAEVAFVLGLDVLETLKCHEAALGALHAMLH